MEPDDFVAPLVPKWKASVSPAEAAALDRCLMGLKDLAVARSRLTIEVAELGKSMQNFAAAWVIAEWHETEAADDEIAAHPDLAQMNVYLDGFYA